MILRVFSNVNDSTILYINFQNTRYNSLILKFWGFILTSTNLSNNLYHSIQLPKQQLILSGKIFKSPATNLDFTAHSCRRKEKRLAVYNFKMVCVSTTLQIGFKQTRLFWEIKVHSVNSECFLWKAWYHNKKSSVTCLAWPLMMLTCVYTQ